MMPYPPAGCFIDTPIPGAVAAEWVVVAVALTVCPSRHVVLLVSSTPGNMSNAE